MSIDAVSVYSRAGKSHKWYPLAGFEVGTAGDYMRSFCGLQERFRNLQRDPGEAISHCAKCKVTALKHKKRLWKALRVQRSISRPSQGSSEKT